MTAPRIRILAGPRPLEVVAGRLCGEAPEAGQVDLELRGEEVSPGAINAHTHLYSGLAPLGLPLPERPPPHFVGILEAIWWRLDRALDATSLRAAARLAVAEALLAGTTTLVDHHESPGFVEGSLGVLAEACDSLGVRAVLGYGATERNGGREEARRGLAECRRLLEVGPGPRIRGAVAIHASFTVSDETLREAGALARRFGAPLHVHVAEDVADVQDARRRGHFGPMERLIALDALTPGSILAHGVHLSAGQVRLAEEFGAWLVHNPRSNEGNRVGYARALAASARVALGTDGYPADMEVERDAGVRLGAAAGEPPTVAAARLAAGAGLIGERFGARFDELSPGYVADLVVRSAGRVVHVLVDGEVVVRDGRLVRGDIDEIRAEAAVAAPGLWARMRALA